MQVDKKLMNQTMREQLEADGDIPVEQRVMWEIGEPPADVLMEVRGSDFIGTWHGVAMRKDYKKPPKGKSGKGFRKKKWRWVYEDGNVFDGTPEAWRTIPT